MVEDIVVDQFRVAGGTTHDWMVNLAGPPRFSMPMASATFEPADWLYNGTDRVQHATVDGTWRAEWDVEGVTARLTMLGDEATQVYALETYPIDNAVITKDHPPCRTLCVRRTKHAPFLAVWDAWRGAPNLEGVSRGSEGESLLLETQSNTYHLRFGPGASRFDDGVSLSSDGAFCLLRNRDAVTLVSGSRLEVTTPEGDLRVALDHPATMSAEFAKGVVTLETAGNIHYDTYGGRDHYRDPPGVVVTLEGDLWRVRESRLRFAGFTP